MMYISRCWPAGHQDVAGLCGGQPESCNQPSLAQRAPRFLQLVRVSSKLLAHLRVALSTKLLLVCMTCRGCHSQGALLFMGLLVLLWVPLLIFSIRW